MTMQDLSGKVAVVTGGASMATIVTKQVAAMAAAR
jgi:hypothetical protein